MHHTYSQEEDTDELAAAKRREDEADKKLKDLENARLEATKEAAAAKAAAAALQAQRLKQAASALAADAAVTTAPQAKPSKHSAAKALAKAQEAVDKQKI